MVAFERPRAPIRFKARFRHQRARQYDVPQVVVMLQQVQRVAECCNWSHRILPRLTDGGVEAKLTNSGAEEGTDDEGYGGRRSSGSETSGGSSPGK